MSEILVFRHIACEGPAYLGQFLTARQHRWRLIRIDRGESVPDSIDGVAGAVFMGGPMSVNDELPWIEATLALIRAAHERGLPLLGHCLGAQLIARALGGTVAANPVREIGWLPIDVTRHERLPRWCGDLPDRFEVFHWHGETFTLPPCAVPLFSSAACTNQGFASGRTLALQFHVEMLADMVPTWAHSYRDEIARPSATVQSETEMMRNLDTRIDASNRIADIIYSAWLEGSH